MFAGDKSVENGGTDNNIDVLTGEERRTKKNKYGQFSKTDQRSQDPLEALIAEAEIKKHELQNFKNKKQRRQKPENVQSLPEIKFPNNKLIDPYDPSTFGYIELGTVISAHGVHGLVKIAAVTDFPARLCSPGVRHIKPPNKRAPRTIVLIEGRQSMGDEYLIKFEGIEDRETANQLRGHILYARQEEKLDDFGNDEYLLSDLVGLDVYLEEGYQEEDSGVAAEASLGGKHVGTVGGIVLGREMSSIPELAHDILEIVLPRGRSGSPSWRDELVLVPFVPQIVPRVDLKGRAIYISPPKGLLDLTYVREENVRIKGYLPSSQDPS
jgi:16S rRNA processing protein RimM